MGITPLKIIKPQIFGHTLLKSIDIALRKFPQPYYDIEFVNFWRILFPRKRFEG
jgi:hypothetical protein